MRSFRRLRRLAKTTRWRRSSPMNLIPFPPFVKRIHLMRRRSFAMIIMPMCLFGCYGSEKSIISMNDAFQPLTPGRYCEQPANKDSSGWATKCSSEVVFSPGPGSAYNGTIEGTPRVIRLHRVPLPTGAFRGGYVTEVCSTDPKDKGTCTVGVVEVLSPERFIWTGPECSLSGSFDFCPVGSEPRARQLFASMDRYRYRKRSRYVRMRTS